MFTVRPPKRNDKYETRPLKFYGEFSEILSHVSIGYSSMSGIFDKTNIPPATTMNIIDHLERVGLVESGESYEDIRLTGKFRHDLKRLHNYLGDV